MFLKKFFIREYTKHCATIAFKIQLCLISMLFHSDVHHSCKLQCEFEVEEWSSQIYRSHDVNQQEGATWLQKFGEQDVVTVCSQYAPVSSFKGLRVSIFHDFPDDGQLVSGWVMVKKHCTAPKCRWCQLFKILNSKTAWSLSHQTKSWWMTCNTVTLILKLSCASVK